MRGNFLRRLLRLSQIHMGDNEEYRDVARGSFWPWLFLLPQRICHKTELYENHNLGIREVNGGIDLTTGE